MKRLVSTAVAVVLAATSSTAVAAPSSSAALQQTASLTLGLADSQIGDVRVVARHDEHTVVGVNVPGAPLVLDLTPHSVRAAGFEARAQLEDGSWVVLPPEPVRTYRGTVVGDPGSVVAASLLDDGLHARIVSSSGQELWVEPLAPHLAQATLDQHVIYRSEDVLATGRTCDADLLPRVAPRLDEVHYGNGTAQGAGGTTIAELGCDADYEYFSTHGAGTQARIESVINTVNLQYASEVGISHSITTILIRTSSNDPYTKKPADQLLFEFRAEWNTNQSGIQRDVAHLFTGRALAGSTIGIAFTGTVCNLDVAYSLVESDFDNNFACVTDLSAHELGHNWGADHCSCSNPPFTMNSFIVCANTFSPTQSRPDILAYRDSQSCFGGGMQTTGTVAGTVTSSAGGAPIAGATVQVDTGQSDTTAGDGSYSIAGVPTGSRTVTASAVGFDSANANTNVSDGATATVNFSLDPAPVGSQAIVDCITNSSTGGGNGDKHLFIDVTIVDDMGNPVVGASVSIAVELDGSPFGTGTATTDASGTVSFNAKNSPNGCYVTDVTSVSAAGLTFDGTEPANGFQKGSDSSPDPDCRSASDGCGAG